MTTKLATPNSVDELYLARGSEVAPYRPLLQGDVYREVDIPGVGLEHEYAMVISHPCSMRNGPVLRDRVQMIPVTPYQALPPEQWPLSHFLVFPLPALDIKAPSEHRAAHLDEIGMVATRDLVPERRVACLSERGILLLQQRSIFRSTRADISISTLQRASGHVFAEVELAEEWNATLVPIRIAPGVDLHGALAAEASEFDAYLGTQCGGYSLREALRVDHLRASVRRQVCAEIAARAATSES